MAPVGMGGDGADGGAAEEPVDHQDLLRRQRDALSDAYLQGVRRLRWDAARLATERTHRLRELLGWAATHSDFWRERLGGRDLATFSEADLPSLPVLTKAEMMAEFDRLVTVPGLTLERVNAHLETVDTEPYLDGAHRVLATSGSGGTRSLVVYGWEDWTTFVMLATRWRGRLGDDLDATMASFYARSSRHVSGALHAFTGFVEDRARGLHLPATSPLADIVERLNAVGPTQLQGYPSIIAVLAQEAAAGRLHVAPTWISTCGEQLTEETRAAVRDAWGVEITDVYGCSEGVYAFPCPGSRHMHLPDDVVILEPVDEEGNVVPFGEPAQRVLLTNLYNRTQPLIRYEIADAMTVFDDPCPCGCAHRRIGDVHGRTDGRFAYPGGAVVPCLGLASILLGDGGVADMHVVQTPRGAHVALTARGPCDAARLERELTDLLRRSGVTHPVVEVEIVDSLERLWSGKVRQFVPLP